MRNNREYEPFVFCPVNMPTGPYGTSGRKRDTNRIIKKLPTKYLCGFNVTHSIESMPETSILGGAYVNRESMT